MKQSQNYYTSNENTIKYKDFYLGNFYLKICLNNNDNEIIYIIYNVILLDSIKYELKLKQAEIYSLSKVFKMYDNLEEIYEILCKLIEENNYKIEYKNNNMILILKICDIFKKDIEIELLLNRYDENNEYMKILSKEVIKIKNNIQNEEINKLIEENKKIKLEIKNLKNAIQNLLCKIDKQKEENKGGIGEKKNSLEENNNKNENIEIIVKEKNKLSNNKEFNEKKEKEDIITKFYNIFGITIENDKIKKLDLSSKL